MRKIAARGLIVSAPRSGAGKTTLALALMAALRRHGLAVKAAKAGPDYIDPAFHAAATGRPSVNLDTWAMPPLLVDALAREAASETDLLLIEGAMGLFDGVPGPPGRTGATADLAARLRLPVLLILDVSGQSQSAAALVRGFAGHDPAVHVAGVILNRVGSDRHRTLVADAIALVSVPVLGALPREEAVALPSRHLGLVQAGEHRELDACLERLADLAERHIDLDAVIAIAAPLDLPAQTTIGPPLSPPGQRIALAADAAFTFTYPHVLDAWRRAGAEIVPFAPLADQGPPQDCDTCWLPGGYPELHAGALAAAENFRCQATRFAASKPIHGECGGYMVLGEYLEDGDGVRHPMLALLGHATSFKARKLHLGYREARLRADSPIGAIGTRVRGHEFHYATLAAPGEDAPLADLADSQGRALGPEGGRRGLVSGAFFHAIAGGE